MANNFYVVFKLHSHCWAFLTETAIPLSHMFRIGAGPRVIDARRAQRGPKGAQGWSCRCPIALVLTSCCSGTRDTYMRQPLLYYMYTLIKHIALFTERTRAQVTTAALVRTHIVTLYIVSRFCTSR